MARHRFDPVALVFGLVFAGAGTIVLTGGRLLDEGRVLAPVGLLALGVALLVRTASRPHPPAPAPAPADRIPADAPAPEPVESAEPPAPVDPVEPPADDPAAAFGPPRKVE